MVTVRTSQKRKTRLILSVSGCKDTTTRAGKYTEFKKRLLRTVLISQRRERSKVQGILMARNSHQKHSVDVVIRCCGAVVHAPS